MFGDILKAFGFPDSGPGLTGTPAMSSIGSPQSTSMGGAPAAAPSSPGLPPGGGTSHPPAQQGAASPVTPGIASASSAASALSPQKVFGLPGYQDGGTIPADQLAVVGERGPELVRSKTPVEVTPNHEIDDRLKNISPEVIAHALIAMARGGLALPPQTPAPDAPFMGDLTHVERGSDAAAADVALRKGLTAVADVADIGTELTSPAGLLRGGTGRAGIIPPPDTEMSAAPMSWPEIGVAALSQLPLGRTVGGAKTAAGVLAGLAGTSTATSAEEAKPDALNSLMEQKKQAQAQRASLDDQRAIAARDAELQLKGGPGVLKPGRGPIYSALQKKVDDARAEIATIDAGIARIDNLIEEENRRRSPEYQRGQKKITEAEGVREKLLSGRRRPYQDVAPEWAQNFQAFAPATVAGVTSLLTGAIDAIKNRSSAKAWRKAIAAGLEARAGTKARDQATKTSEAFSREFPEPKGIGEKFAAPYGKAAALGGFEGGAVTNLPDVYNAFLPALNQEQQAYVEYLKLLPQDAPERKQAEEIVQNMPSTTPARDAALAYFGSSAMPVRTGVGVMEGIGGALVGKSLSNMLEPKFPRAEAAGFSEVVRQAAIRAAEAKKRTSVPKTGKKRSPPKTRL